MAVLRWAVALLLAAGGECANCTNYMGYLVDLFSWYQPNMIGLDGSMLSTSPQDHLVDCALMTQAKTSGFGLLNRSGSMYSLAYVFDGETNSLALTYLTMLRELQPNGTAFKNISVEVCGAASGSMLAASLIADASGQTWVMTSAPTKTWRACSSGYLVDLISWHQPGHVRIDGAPLATAPQNHSVGVLLLSASVASGFGLITQGAEGVYDLAYMFNNASNGLVLKYLGAIKAAGATKNVMVSMCGKPDPLDAKKTTAFTITDTSGVTSVAVSATPDTDAAWPLTRSTQTETTASGASARSWATLAGAASVALLAWAPVA